MLIGAYGMFWLRDEVDWNPGPGPNAWTLLGRNGTRRPKLRVADFRFARGVYVLFDDFGPYYAGLAKSDGGLGDRLKAHTTDKHRKAWDRFCWYSFDGVAAHRGGNGLHPIDRRDRPVPSDDDSVIGEMEALLISILGTRGQNRMRFERAERWEQVSWYERDAVLRRVTEDNEQ